MNQERFEALMVRVADGLATPQEEEELMRHIAERPELQVELDAHRALKAVTDGWVDRLRLDVAEDTHRNKTATRFVWGIGGLLFAVGLGVLTGGGVVEAMLDPSAPLWLKTGVGGMTAGTLIGTLAAVRWRLQTYAHDDYTEVIR